jgi:iron complex transport system ATP-binding protein
MSLKLEKIALSLGDQPVIRDVSFELKPGEIVGLLGRNGVGKTSLLRIASGTLQADAGTVRLGDRVLAAWSRREIAQRIAVVPQDMHVPFPFRVGELVLMGRAPYQSWLGFESSADVERAVSAMERMGIEGLANRFIHELSGGERQLVLFARALAQQPEFLLLDEATAFLDLSHRVALLGAVAELAQAGCAVLLVSHDLSLASRACHRLVLLADGTVAAEGPPGEVLDPAGLRRVFGFEARVQPGPDGLPIVIPEIPGPKTVPS